VLLDDYDLRLLFFICIDDATDENGNPLEASRLLQRHKQMREPPVSQDRTPVANSQNHNTISYSYGDTYGATRYVKS